MSPKREAASIIWPSVAAMSRLKNESSLLRAMLTLIVSKFHWLCGTVDTDGATVAADGAAADANAFAVAVAVASSTVVVPNVVVSLQTHWWQVL